MVDELGVALQRCRRSGGTAAVLQMDMVDFKQTNDTFGHAAGDQLLVAFADVLRGSVRRTDTAGRLGGDEFAVVLAGAGAAENAVATARRILDAASRPRSIDAQEMTMRVSIGIAVASDPAHADLSIEPERLMQRADAAMYVAKRQHGHGLYVYTEEIQDRHRPQPAGVQQALLTYEPVFALADGAIVAVEARIRRAPQDGVVDGTDWGHLTGPAATSFRGATGSRPGDRSTSMSRSRRPP